MGFKARRLGSTSENKMKHLCSSVLIKIFSQTQASHSQKKTCNFISLVRIQKQQHLDALSDRICNLDKRQME